jgi:hypothetical protein
MGQDHRLAAAQPKLFAIPGGDAAIYALSVGDSDKWPMMTVQEFLGQKRQSVEPFILMAFEFAVGGCHGFYLTANRGALGLRFIHRYSILLLFQEIVYT